LYDPVSLEADAAIARLKALCRFENICAAGERKRRKKRVPNKVDTIDIFRIQPDGELVWIDSTVSLEDGRARVSKLMVNTPGEYFLFCQKTQEKIYVGKSNSADFKSRT
jgi:hypothetical protein